MMEQVQMIPVMLLQHKENKGRFLALSIEHIDMEDPNGNVTLDNVKNAHVIYRQDNKPPTDKDLEQLLEESDRYVEMMKAKYGDKAIISYNIRKWLETHEPYHHEVDIPTYNLIALENEWNKQFGTKTAAKVSDYVIIYPFPAEPTIQNVYVVEAVEDNYVDVIGMNGWERVPNIDCNLKVVDSNEIKFEFEDNSSDKYQVQVANDFESAALSFNNGWNVQDCLKFSLNDMDFCMTFDYPKAILSDAHSGLRIKDFVIPIPINSIHVELLRKWILSDPVASLIDLFNSKVSVEKFKEQSEASLSAAVAKFGDKPNVKNVALEKGLDARIKMIKDVLGEELIGATFEDKQAFVEAHKVKLDSIVKSTLSSMYEVFTGQIKVYRLNDCDWVAAKSLEDAIAWYQANIEDDPDAIYEEEEIKNLETFEITFDVMEKDDVDYAIYGHLQEKYFAEGEKTFKVPANELLGIEWCGQPFILCSKEP